MADRYNALLLFGAPGVGKGTQGKILGAIPGMRHLATGDMFRSVDKQSELGQKIAGYMWRGELVPDDLTVQLWRQHVEGLVRDGKFAPKQHLLILDGIPRSRQQAAAIEPHINVLRIVHLTCPDINDMVARMKRRAQQENRMDDADENVIRRRFTVYEEETRPVLSFYNAELVVEVNAVGTPAEVLMHILKGIVPAYNEHCGNPLGA